MEGDEQRCRMVVELELDAKGMLNAGLGHPDTWTRVEFEQAIRLNGAEVKRVRLLVGDTDELFDR